LFLIFLGAGFEMLTVVRIYNVVWVRLQYSWYVVMFVLEEHSVPIFTGHQNMVAVCPE
jgi:hypothetical protein